MHRLALIVLAAGLLAAPAFCGEAEGKGEGGRGPRHGMVIKFVLDHAKELALTDDQKDKIEALVKEHEARKGEGRPEPKRGEGRPEGKAEGKHRGPLADILTEEQGAKLHELLKANRPEGKKESEDKP